MKECVIPGSFDPITCGHMNLIERSAKIFDNVTVAVMVNISKSGVIPYQERVEIIRKACQKVPNVKVILWKGLLAEYIKEHPECVVIRSVRNCGEFEHEVMSADINRRLCPEMETLLLPASSELSEISSSAVREIASFGGNISGLVPSGVYKEIQKRLKEAAARI